MITRNPLDPQPKQPITGQPQPLQTGIPLGALGNDPLFARALPEANVHIQQKIVDIGVNYFSSFKGQKGRILRNFQLYNI